MSSLGFETSVGVLSLTSPCSCSTPHPGSFRLLLKRPTPPFPAVSPAASVKPALGWGRHPLDLTARFGHLPGGPSFLFTLKCPCRCPQKKERKKEQLPPLPSAFSSNSTACQLPQHTLLMNAGSWAYLGVGWGVEGSLRNRAEPCRQEGQLLLVLLFGIKNERGYELALPSSEVFPSCSA